MSAPYNSSEEAWAEMQEQIDQLSAQVKKLEVDAACFNYLQNCDRIKAQAYFWNFESRKQRKKQLLEDMKADLQT